MKKVYRVLFLLIMAGVYIQSAQADISVAAEAVLGNLVVMQINGKREKLRVGETRHDVKVIEANNNAVIVSINGQTQRIKVGAAAVRDSYSRVKKVEQIGINSQGMYRTAGTINNQATAFLIDTGATYVALSEAHAHQLGIEYRNGKLSRANTANGIVSTYEIRLDSVSIGGIKLEQVDGVVIAGKGTSEILLGMSFLSRVDVSYKNGVMTLESN